MLEYIQYISIIIEAVVAILGLMLVFKKKKSFGWGIFITFAIYVIYDFAKLANFSINSDLLYSLFFLATLSILFSVISIYKRK